MQFSYSVLSSVQKNCLTIIRSLLSCDTLVSVDLEGRSIKPSWRLLKLISFADFQTKTSCRLWTKFTSQKCLKNYNILASDSSKGGISIDREWDERGIYHGSTGWFSKLCRCSSLLETDCQWSWQPFKAKMKVKKKNIQKYEVERVTSAYMLFYTLRINFSEVSQFLAVHILICISIDILKYEWLPNNVPK